MCRTHNEFREALQAAFSRALQPFGYTQRGLLFMQSTDTMVCCIEFQMSRRIRDRFAINIGIDYLDRHQNVPRLEMANLLMRARLSLLLTRRDTWFYLDEIKQAPQQLDRIMTDAHAMLSRQTARFTPALRRFPPRLMEKEVTVFVRYNQEYDAAIAEGGGIVDQMLRSERGEKTPLQAAHSRYERNATLATEVLDWMLSLHELCEYLSRAATKSNAPRKAQKYRQLAETLESI